MKACGDSIILAPIKMEKKTESGIEIVQERQRHDAQLSVGKVVDIGPLAYEKEVYFSMETNRPVRTPQVGDFVITAKYAGYEVKMDEDQVFKVCTSADLNAIIAEDEVKKLTTWKP